MPDKQKSKIAGQWLVPTIIVLALFIFAGCRYGFWFASNDDYVMNAILSGAYLGRSDIHNVYMSPVLGVVFSALYRVIPAVPWYGLFLAGSQFAALWLCLRCIYGRCEQTLTKIVGTVCFAALFSALLFSELVFCQYTLVAAVLADSAVFLVLLDRQEEAAIRWKSLVVPFALYVLAELLRSNVGLMHLVFLGIACLYRLLWAEGSRTSRAQKVLLTAAAILLGLGAVLHETILVIGCIGLLCCYLIVWLIQSFRQKKAVILKYTAFFAGVVVTALISWAVTYAVYHAGSWADYTEFNQYRTELYDYNGVPYYGEYEELYGELGFTGNGYYLLANCDIAFSDLANTEAMQRLSEASAPDRTFWLNDIKRIILNVVDKFQSDPMQPYDNLLIVTFLAAAFVCLLGQDWMALLQLQFLAFAHVLCWSYLYWLDRVLDRVTVGIYLAEILLLAAVCILKSAGIRQRMSRGILYLGLGIGTIYFTVVMVQEMTAFGETYQETIEKNQSWEACKEYCRENPEQLYFLDVLSFSSFSESIFDPYRTQTQNYELAGGWFAKSPLYDEKLNNYGISGTIYEELESGGVIYYICEFGKGADWIADFFADYDVDVDIQRVDGIFVDFEEVMTVYMIAGNA
ncbi:MAG: hypothetical protein LUH19_07595 [Lachnospiraceae bacterium]|nr:hypothetical protein [Lachnospiraceae bacterium]